MISRWLLAGSLALAACAQPRQLVLSIDTAVGVPCDIDHVRITTKNTRSTVFERSLQGAQLPVSITLLDDTPDGTFDLEVSGLKGGREVLRASGSLEFSSHTGTETVLLDPKCTADAPPCTLSDAMSAGAASPVTARATCRYGATKALDSSPDACMVPNHGMVPFDTTHKPIVPVALTALEPQLASSGFRFYGQPIRRIWVAKDGYISFTQNSPDPGGVLIPGPLDRDITHMGEPPPLQSVMAFWDTLSLSAAGVCYDLEGAQNNQLLHLTWNHACLTSTCTATDNLTFTITLEEATQRVLLTYGNMTADNMERAHGATATVGVVKDAAGCPADECALGTGLCKDGATPCGYSQVFSSTYQDPIEPNMQFVPIFGSH
jgi:hypothetical protein